MRFIPILTFALSAASGIYWGAEKRVTVQLQTRLDEIKDWDVEIDRLRQERDRLARLQPVTGVLEHLRSRVHERGQDAQGSNEQANDGAFSLRPGIWAPASTWKNQGRATPEAAVETILWAAAGGDVGKLKDTLVLPPETRLKATDLLASLPTDSRQSYVSPEDLMAVMVAGSVPLDSAQVVARQQNQDNQVIEYLRLKDSSGRTRQVYLSLQKAPDGWQLMVPRNAVDQIEKDPGTPSDP